MIEIRPGNRDGLGHDYRQRQQEGKTGGGMQKTERVNVNGNGNRKKAVSMWKELSTESKITLDKFKKL